MSDVGAVERHQRKRFVAITSCSNSVTRSI
jgi:hypothetical protein